MVLGLLEILSIPLIEKSDDLSLIFGFVMDSGALISKELLLLLFMIRSLDVSRPLDRPSLVEDESLV